MKKSGLFGIVLLAVIAVFAYVMVKSPKPPTTVTPPSTPSTSTPTEPTTPSDPGEPTEPTTTEPATPTTATPVKTTEKVNQKDGAAMVLVPAGEFLMGSSKKEIDAWVKAHPGGDSKQFSKEQPQRKVTLDAYYIYKTEVTVAQFKKYCKATKREMPKAPEWGWQDSHPMVCVSWNDASAYAQWAGATLPTEAQWEKAARGTDGRLFPWGATWPPTGKVGNFADASLKKQKDYLKSIAKYDDGFANTAPVGSYPAGAGPYGALDMAGNAWEWCADLYADSYPKTSPVKNPTGPVDGSLRVLRGGCWNSFDPAFFRTTLRMECDPTYNYPYFGFRCVVPAAAK